MWQFCLIRLFFFPSLFGVLQRSTAETEHPLMKNYLKHLRQSNVYASANFEAMLLVAAANNFSRSLFKQNQLVSICLSMNLW